MFRGSVIDSEFQGISTIQIMNMLNPDVVTLGNHEVDYGIAHLLFLEKCATFPIVNANLYIKTNHTRLFDPCHIIEIDGMKVLFIGILTEQTIMQCRTDGLVGSFIALEEAADEIGKICNTYNGIDIDFTVLLTHIGFEEDKKLAAILDPDWGVDVIIGGHSHTYPYENAAHLLHMTGAQIKHAIRFMLRDEALAGEHTEFYQLSSGMQVEYDQEQKTFLRFDFEDEPIEDEKTYTVGMEHFHLANLPESFDLTIEDVCGEFRPRVISTSCTQIIEEALCSGLAFEGYTRSSHTWIGNSRFSYWGTGGVGSVLLGDAHLSRDGTELIWEDFYFSENVEVNGGFETRFFYNTTGLYDADGSMEITEEEFDAITEKYMNDDRVNTLELTPLSVYGGAGSTGSTGGNGNASLGEGPFELFGGQYQNFNAGVVANIWEQSTGIVFAFDIEDASFQGDTSYDDVKGRLGFYAVDHTTDDVVTGYVETDGNGIRVTFTGSESGSVSAGDVYTLDKVD